MVSVVNDTILENDEQFTVELQTADQAVTLDPQSSVVIISDNDGMMNIISWSLGSKMAVCQCTNYNAILNT